MQDWEDASCWLSDAHGISLLKPTMLDRISGRQAWSNLPFHRILFTLLNKACFTYCWSMYCVVSSEFRSLQSFCDGDYIGIDFPIPTVAWFDSQLVCCLDQRICSIFLREKSFSLSVLKLESYFLGHRRVSSVSQKQHLLLTPNAPWEGLETQNPNETIKIKIQLSCWRWGGPHDELVWPWSS